MTLDTSGVLRFDRSKTNWEYLRALRAAGRADVYDAMTPLTREFDRIWYGFASADASRITARALTQYDALQAASQVPVRRPPDRQPSDHSPCALNRELLALLFLLLVFVAGGLLLTGHDDTRSAHGRAKRLVPDPSIYQRPCLGERRGVSRGSAGSAIRRASGAAAGPD